MGLEAVIILFAAIFAFPAPFKNKVIGFVAGFFAIQLLNLVRIISLYYLGQWNYTAFEWFHLYLWQALIILDALVVWLIWLRTLPGSRAHPDNPEPETAVMRCTDSRLRRCGETFWRSHCCRMAMLFMA